MKRTTAIISILILLVLFSSFTLANKGVGIVWSTESELVKENELHCIDYGIYNPWDEDVTAVLSVSDELKPVIAKSVTEPQFIEARTTNENAKQMEFCFKVGKQYEEDCLMPLVGCKQTCEQPQVSYDGKVIVIEDKEGESSGTGSTTSLGVSVPLNIRVACEEHGRDFTLVYIVVVIIILIILGIIFLRRHVESNGSYES